GAVVNQHRAHKDYDRAELEFSLGEQLSAVLPFDPNSCWRAVEEQRAVVFGQRSSFARSMLQFAERLHGGQLEMPRPAAKQRRQAWWKAVVPEPRRRQVPGAARLWTHGGKA